MDTVTQSGAIVFDTPAGIEFFQMASLKGALKLECHGIKVKRGFSAWKTCKERYNLKGNKHAVLEQMEKLVADAIAKKHEVKK